MKKKAPKCVVCGGNLIYDDIYKSYRCSKCNASIDSNVFSVSKEQIVKKRKWIFRRTRLLIAILGSLYLLWLIWRIFT